VARISNLLPSTALTASAALASGATLAADLRMPVKAPPAVLPFSWTGCYVGLNVGGVSTRLRHSLDIPAGLITPPFAHEASERDTSFIGGGQIGCNYQFDPSWVVGLEGDINYVNSSQDSRFRFTRGSEDVVGSQSTRLRWLSTIRGRLGPTWGSTFLYVTGGLAIGNINSSVSATSTIGPDTTYAGSRSQTRLGGTIGAGLEHAFSNRVSAKIEYLHFDLGSFDYSVTRAVPGPGLPATWNASAKVSGDIVRVGLNVRFNP
jgi:outer membrane immunogenic protein